MARTGGREWTQNDRSKLLCRGSCAEDRFNEHASVLTCVTVSRHRLCKRSYSVFTVSV